jgi:hypothetical protein
MAAIFNIEAPGTVRGLDRELAAADADGRPGGRTARIAATVARRGRRSTSASSICATTWVASSRRPRVKRCSAASSDSPRALATSRIERSCW